MSKQDNASLGRWEWIMFVGIGLSAIIIIRCTFIEDFYNGLRGGTFISISAFVFLVIGIICIFGEIIISLKRTIFELEEHETKRRKEVRTNYEKQLYTQKKEYEQKLSSQNKINISLSNLLKSKKPFRDVAVIKADYETCIFEKDEHYLRYKPHPAASAADKVKEIRDQYKTSLIESKQMLYKYEFLLSVFLN